MTTLQIAKLCRKAAADKKALDPVLLDIRAFQTFTDYFLIVSGQSDPQLKAIADEIERRVQDEADVRVVAREGASSSGWMILDLSDIIVHIFHERSRAYYQIEQLWNDAKKVR